MGYRGKVREQEEARRLRAESWTLEAIAEHLEVSKSSVSLWVRDVDFVPSRRRYGARTPANAQHERKLQQITELEADGRRRIGTLSDDAFFTAGAPSMPAKVRSATGRCSSAIPTPR